MSTSSERTDKPDRVPAARSGPSAAQAISNGMVQLVARYSGRGPTRARTTLNSNVIVVVFGDVMTTAEHTFRGKDRADEVRATRQRLQDVIRDEAREVVEGVTGRRVRSVLSDIDPAQDLAVQVFLLDEIPETGDVDVAEATAEGASE
jgi:uncharacterized protein YbcI